MDVEAIVQYILDNFEGMLVKEAFGEMSFFYNPGRVLPGGVLISGIKERDGLGDQASHLHRPGVYRLDFGSSKETFMSLFGQVPRRPPKGEVIQVDYDFEKLDSVMPHPVYGWAYWMCVLNPSESTFEKLKPIIEEYYQLSKERFENRNRGLKEV